MGVLNYGSSRACSLQSCFLGILLLLWEEGSLLGSEKPHEREKPNSEPALIFSHMSEAILDHPAPDKLLGDNYDKSKPR